MILLERRCCSTPLIGTPSHLAYKSSPPGTGGTHSSRLSLSQLKSVSVGEYGSRQDRRDNRRESFIFHRLSWRSTQCAERIESGSNFRLSVSRQHHTCRMGNGHDRNSGKNPWLLLLCTSFSETTGGHHFAHPLAPTQIHRRRTRP